MRVAITGVDALPRAEVRTEAQGLVLSVVPGAETDASEAGEAIQVVVTDAQEGYNPSTAITDDWRIRNALSIYSAEAGGESVHHRRLTSRKTSQTSASLS